MIAFIRVNPDDAEDKNDWSPVSATDAIKMAIIDLCESEDVVSIAGAIYEATTEALHIIDYGSAVKEPCYKRDKQGYERGLGFPPDKLTPTLEGCGLIWHHKVMLELWKWARETEHFAHMALIQKQAESEK